MNRTLRNALRLGLSGLAGLAVCAALIQPAVAAPKPGFLPGTWNVVGTIAGSSVDGPMSTTFGGGLRFTLKVKPNLAVGGSGTWAMTMRGTGPVGSSMEGKAAVLLAGTATNVRFAGQQQVTGSVSDGVLTTPIRFTRPVNGMLVIKRAGKCRVTGTAPMGDGATLKWTALLAGSGTCRA